MTNAIEAEGLTKRFGTGHTATQALAGVDLAAREGSEREGGQDDGMRSETIEIRTGGNAVVHDLDKECSRFVGTEGDGLLNVFVPHATAGLAILETGAGSDDDLLTAVDELLPRDGRWRHRHGSSGHGRDHVLPAFIAPSLIVPVIAGRMQLGTWQSVCLVDTNIDNAVREVRLSFLAG